MVVTKSHFKYKDIDILKKRMEKDMPCNTMKAGMAILISDKVDFRTRNIARIKKDIT